MSKTCQAFVSDPFTSSTALLPLGGEAVPSQGAAHSAHSAHPAHPWLCFGSPRAQAVVPGWILHSPGKGRQLADPHPAAGSASAVCSHKEMQWLDLLLEAITHPVSGVKSINLPPSLPIEELSSSSSALLQDEVILASWALAIWDNKL